MASQLEEPAARLLPRSRPCWSPKLSTAGRTALEVCRTSRLVANVKYTPAMNWPDTRRIEALGDQQGPEARNGMPSISRASEPPGWRASVAVAVVNRATASPGFYHPPESHRSNAGQSPRRHGIVGVATHGDSEQHQPGVEPVLCEEPRARSDCGTPGVALFPGDSPLPASSARRGSGWQMNFVYAGGLDPVLWQRRATALLGSYTEENWASRPLCQTQASDRQTSSWVGDHQRIPAVVCFALLPPPPLVVTRGSTGISLSLRSLSGMRDRIVGEGAGGECCDEPPCETACGAGLTETFWARAGNDAIESRDSPSKLLPRARAVSGWERMGADESGWDGTGSTRSSARPASPWRRRPRAGPAVASGEPLDLGGPWLSGDPSLRQQQQQQQPQQRRARGLSLDVDSRRRGPA
ncbi:hypothetical protein B2J93_754 [Marssonina coronariae]|uniref:Uncharacterized protein n=1 Tax=Diplocarpon coronariae TaxID=2795749 RepID=A0A218YYM2_9HELO|nr:hypothetical protein B2J93_754 [Marssonina coronariae]